MDNTLTSAPGAAARTELPAQVDVAIVGSGPTGVALGNLLGQAGLRVALLDRALGVLPIPRAIHIDGETMRVFQSMGLAPALLKLLRPGGSMHWVNAQGETLLVRKGVQGLGVHGWHNDYYFHQPEMEEALRVGLGRFANVSLHEQLELTVLAQDAEGVELTLKDVAPGAAGATRSLRACYVVGCDGARSTVRQWVGGDDFDDLGEHQAWLVVDGVLTHPLDLPEHSVQHCDPARPATSIYVHPLRRRWELMLLPGEDPKVMTELEQVWPMLSRWVKPSQATLERAATYVFHSLVARQWQNGRVLLAGDAAHQTPPFLGQGLCAAVRDVANLGWKLVHALRQPGAAADALLASYGPERIPHAREFIALAVEVGRVIQVTDPALAAERDAKLVAQGHSFVFPSPTLGSGCHLAQEGLPAVGKVAPQFEGADGRWSDDVAGPAWSLLVSPELRPALLAQQASPLSAPSLQTVAQQLRRLGVVVLAAPGERATRWLAEQGAVAALLRPDRYVAALSRTADELPSLCVSLAAWLGTDA